MTPHLHIMVILLHVLLNIVSQSDTESGVQFHLAPSVQKLVYRRIGQYVSLRGQSHGGGPHGLSPYSFTYCGNVMAHHHCHPIIYVHV